MSLAIVLSGGGARGDFEVGALELIYERGFRPDILVGTSVGAINAVKLAEGEGDPDQGFRGLKQIWLSLLHNSDMWEPEPWISEINARFARALVNGQSLDIAEPSPPDPAWGDIAKLLYAIHGFAFLISDGAAILQALGKLISARALFNLRPIQNRIQSTALNIDHVRAWANTGKRLRLATVNLETGRLRYVTETGLLVEEDHTTPVQMVQATTPEISDLRRQIAELESEVADAQAELSTAAPGAKAGLAQRITSLRRQISALYAQLRQAEQSAGTAPLTVPVGAGAIASASIGALFPPTKLGDGYYVDGGHRDILPLQAAIDLQADTIFAVLASPIELDPPTLEDPEPTPQTYGQRTVLKIALRSLISIPLDEILRNEIRPPANWNGTYRLIAPTVALHDMLTIDPGLIRINMDYGYMRAADTLDGFDRQSEVARQVDRITLLRAQLWRKECELFGRPIPTAPSDDPEVPHPEEYSRIRDLAATVVSLVEQRRAAGRGLPVRAMNWGKTWEAHPWFVTSRAPVTAVAPGTDELLVAGITDEGKENGRVMFAHWAPTSGWRGWHPLEFAYGPSASFVGATVADDRAYVFWIGPDGWVYHKWREANGSWGPWWPVGNSNYPSLNGQPGGAVHAVSCQPGMLHVFYTNRQGRILVARRDTAAGGTWPEHQGILGGETLPGGHVTAVSRSPGQIDVFTVGTDGRMYTAAWNAQDRQWRGWWAIEGLVTAAGTHIAAVSRHLNYLDIFVADAQGRTMTAYWAAEIGWNGWFHVQGGLTLVPQGSRTALECGYVTAVSRSTDKLDIFTTGTDWRVYTAAWEPAFGWRGWWPINDARSRGLSPVWPVSRSTDKLDIFFVNPDNMIQTCAWEPGRTWGGPWTINERWDLRE
jgi:predicted acylesterase/phospholipase RssA